MVNQGAGGDQIMGGAGPGHLPVTAILKGLKRNQFGALNWKSQEIYKEGIKQASRKINKKGLNRYRLSPHFTYKINRGAETQNRTGDTRIFSPLLYRLSYLGTNGDLIVSEKFVKKKRH
jgi:hypothetical protein